MKPLLLAAAASFALAASSLPLLADGVDEAIDAFVKADGFERHDTDAVDTRLLEAFLDTGAMRPDGAANPLEKALLLVETLEEPLPHARYILRYGQMLESSGTDPVPISFVTVERYNLAPALRRQAIEDYGEENVDTDAPVAGAPHVAWRIVTMPLMGQVAAVLETARREIPEDEAQAADCLGRGCLSVDTAIDEGRDWEEVDIRISAASAYEPDTLEGVARPARAVAELAIAAGHAEASGGEPWWRGVEQPEAARGSEPFLFAVVDAGLGQEIAMDAVLGQTLLNDHAIAELWFRRIEVPETVYWLRSTTQR